MSIFPAPRRRLFKIVGINIVACGLCLSLTSRLSARVTNLDDNNLIKNSSFEEGSNLPSWQMGSIPPNADPPITVSIDSGTAHSGKSSLKFERTQRGFFPVSMCSQQIVFDGSQSKIKVGLWAKAESVSKATMAVMFQGGDGSIEWGAYIGAQNPGDSPANHDWKHYGAVLAIPSGTTGITIALETYGPGSLWVDDVSAAYVPATTPLQPAMIVAEEKAEDAEADIKDVTNMDLKVGKDPMKRYFLIGPNKAPQPAEGYKLLLVMPGGDGSADFNAFVRRISKFALPDGYVVAELVAPKWSAEQSTQVVWPIRRQHIAGVRFTTEEFIDSVVADVSKKMKIDANKVFTLSWSSGGPAAYSASLSHGSVKGSFIAMSVFKPTELPALFEAKGLPYYIYHSPDDHVCPLTQAKQAADALKQAGAITKLTTYSGGHGWHGDIFGSIREGMLWLESPKQE